MLGLMNNPYQAPVGGLGVDERRLASFKPAHIGMATFFGSALIGGLCLAISELKCGRPFFGLLFFVCGLVIVAIAYVVSGVPGISVFTIFINLFWAMAAFRISELRIKATGQPGDIRFMSGWLVFWMLVGYWVIGWACMPIVH